MRARLISLRLAPLLGLAVLAALAADPPAAAAAHRGNAALRRFCAGDAAIYCSAYDPGSRRMDACFRRNMRQLSPGCRRAIRSYRASGRR